MAKDKKVGYELFIDMMKNYFIENENMSTVKAEIKALNVAKIYENKLYKQKKTRK